MPRLRDCFGVLLLIISSQALSAEITCQTKFPDLVPEEDGVTAVNSRDLDDWLIVLKDDDCAQETFSQYDELAAVVAVYEPGAQLSEIEIVNRSAAILDALKSVLSQEDFYNDNENKILNLLPERVTIESVKDIYFHISSVGLLDGNARFLVGKSRNAEIDVLLTYRNKCAEPTSSACQEWERFVRFFAAMTHAVKGISESQSRLKLETLKAGLDEYISHWDEYYENRKPQLPWELLGNEIWNRDIRESVYFPRPPKSDLVLFHPQLVYTDFDTSDSEAAIESTILWEIVGINYWDNSLVSGVSLASSKLNSSDSMGVLITLKNVYSLGVFEQDDDETWFLSVDLFDFVVDKQNEFEQQLKENLEQL